jgi:phage major head subunit gpT-like protein
MLQSATYGRLLEPGLRKIFFSTYQELPEQYSQVFNVQTSKKAIETDYRMGGFGLWEKKDSAGAVKYQDPTGTQPLQYIHEEFASGFTVERKLIDDEQYGTINKMSASLARAARVTIETKASTVLNTAFTQNGFDGAPLVSGVHKRLDGKYMSNLLGRAVNVDTGSTTDGTTGAPQFGAVANGALSDRNLKGALIQARAQVDDRGLLIQCNPKILIVPPALEYVAKTIVNGGNLSALGNGTITTNTANMTNDINAIKNQFRVVVMDYLSASQGGSDTAWFVIDPTVAELNFFWRKKLEFQNQSDFSTMQAQYQGYMRFSVGYSDYRGIVGSAGTGAA